MHTGITCTTRTLVGIPFTIYPTENLQSFTHTKHFPNIQQQKSNHTQTYWELFPQTIRKHRQTHKTSRSNKDIDKGNSYRPISLRSVIAKTLEKSLLPYITANIPNTSTQHGYKTQHSTVPALHTVNNTISKGSTKWSPLREQSL